MARVECEAVVLRSHGLVLRDRHLYLLGAPAAFAMELEVAVLRRPPALLRLLGDTFEALVDLPEERFVQRLAFEVRFHRLIRSSGS